MASPSGQRLEVWLGDRGWMDSSCAGVHESSSRIFIRSRGPTDIPGRNRCVGSIDAWSGTGGGGRRGVRAGKRLPGLVRSRNNTMARGGAIRRSFMFLCPWPCCPLDFVRAFNSCARDPIVGRAEDGQFCRGRTHTCFRKAAGSSKLRHFNTPSSTGMSAPRYVNCARQQEGA